MRTSLTGARTPCNATHRSNRCAIVDRIPHRSDRCRLEAFVITRAQYLDFFATALTGMADIVAELGDDQANRRLPQSGANTPYALLNHCLGAIDYWVGEVALGRPAHRDRDAEFTASGPVAPLLERVQATIDRLAEDVAAAREDVD